MRLADRGLLQYARDQADGPPLNLALVVADLRRSKPYLLAVVGDELEVVDGSMNERIRRATGRAGTAAPVAPSLDAMERQRAAASAGDAGQGPRGGPRELDMNAAIRDAAGR